MARPAQMVWCPDLGSTEDDARPIDAYSPDSAAREWAEREDAESADYRIVGGTEANVSVRDPDGGLHHFVVSGESMPYYRARRVAEGIAATTQTEPAK